MLDERYLEWGLTALARAGATQAGWQGHAGACVLAAHYLAAEQDLSPRALEALGRAIDKQIRAYGGVFDALPEQAPRADLLARIPHALESSVDSLCAIGHNVIFAALALKALLDRPDCVTPNIIDGLCALIHSFDDQTAIRLLGGAETIEVEDASVESDPSVPEYDGSDAMIRFTFDELNRFETIYRGYRAHPGHLITHAHALVELERLGYGRLARRGYDAHRLHAKVLRRIHRFESAERALIGPQRLDALGAEFWEAAAAKPGRVDPHKFKYTYSFFSLFGRVTGAGRRAKSLSQLACLVV
jgi:hypothetical protein